MSQVMSVARFEFTVTLCRCRSFWLAAQTLPILLVTAISLAQGQPQSIVNQQSQSALQPATVDVIPLAQGKKPGEEVPVRILLKDGAGQPANALENTTIELNYTKPSGKNSTTTIHLAPGENSKDTTIVIDEPGITKLKAKNADDTLRGSTNNVLITPKARRSDKPKKAANQSRRKAFLFYPGRMVPSAELEYASFNPPAQGQNAVPADSGGQDQGPQLLFTLSGENDVDGVRANGEDFARVQIFYVAPTPPSSDIKIWLLWSNGDIDHNPITLAKGSFAAEAHWTSKYTIQDAKVLVAATNPALRFQSQKEAHVRFGAPILKIDFLNPPDTISIVDMVNLVAEFQDSSGTPVPTTVARSYRFASNSPVLRLNPEHDEVVAGKSEFSTVALPTSIGTVTVLASTPGYKPALHLLKVTGTAVMLLCVVGGILGGILGYINSQGNLRMRVLSGVIVGAVASWAYVYIGLPKASALILHSQLSVLFISILAAVAGVKIIGLITKGLGLDF